MADSSIEWTQKTWNPVRGCTKVSPGCKNCYAETFAERWRGIPGHPYEQGFDLRLVPDKLAEPSRWKKPARIFVNSMSDLFHEDVPNEYIAAVFGVMAACPQHTFQVLTKRAARMLAWFRWSGLHAAGAAWTIAYQANVAGARVPYADPAMQGPWPLPNVHLGVSVESPDYLGRLDDLMMTPAAVRWVSLEPLLAGVDVRPWLGRRAGGHACTCLGESGCRGRAGLGENWRCAYETERKLDWVVIGGESGPGARPFDLDWGRKILADCKAANVPAFWKQSGSAHRCVHSTKGGCLACAPAGLRIREYPNVT